MKAGKEHHAVFHNALYGPNFGGSADLDLLFDDRLDDNWCSNGSFDIPGEQYDLAGVGAREFTVDEIEVFAV